MSFDLVIRGGTVVTAEKTLRADIGIQGGKIAAIGNGLSGKRVLDASGKLVMPGGIDSHCHIEQLSGMGMMSRRRLLQRHGVRGVRRHDDHHSVRRAAPRRLR